jgi:DNA-binding transcriptional LysR family regulator
LYDLKRLGLISTRLHCFQTVARTGSIRKAAVALSVAPSAVSRTIHALEQDLKTPLFERGRQRIRLTSAGELLVYHAKSVATELNQACRAIDDLQGLEHGTVTISVIESVAQGFLANAFNDFWSTSPDVTIHVTIGTSKQAMDAVADGESDLGLAFDERPAATSRSLAVMKLGIGAVVTPKHRLARYKTIRFADLADERLILPDHNLNLGINSQEFFSRLAESSQARVSTNSIRMMIDLATRGSGVGFQTKIGLTEEIARKRVVFVPINEPRVPIRNLRLFCRDRRQMSKAASMLGNALAKRIGSFK